MGVDQVRVVMVLGCLSLCTITSTKSMAQQRVVSANAPEATTRGSVTVAVSGVPLKAALQAIAREAGLNVVFSAAVTESPVRVTLHIRKVSVEEAFEKALAGTRLRATVVHNDVVFEELGATSAQVTQGGISGKVIDGKTKQGLRGATVTLDENTKGTTSEAGGGFRFANVVPGGHTLRIRMLGYAKTTRTVTVVEEQTSSVEIALEPSLSTLDQVVVTGTVVPTAIKAIPNAITVITAQELEERGITHIDQLFRGDVPGLFASNASLAGTGLALGKVQMFSRGATALSSASAGTAYGTNAIKTYVDGIELADPSYLSQIDPKSIERIEILTGPQASTLYGSNAINGVMQIFTKRGNSARPQITTTLLSGVVQNNFSSSLAPQHDYSAQASGLEGRLSYQVGGSWTYLGAWIPARRTASTNGFGGIHLQAGSFTSDASFRASLLKSTTRGGRSDQGQSSHWETGELRPVQFAGRGESDLQTVATQTFGLTVGYVPTAWWSHEVIVGTDLSTQEILGIQPTDTYVWDTLLTLIQYPNTRTSLRYTMTTRLPVIAGAQAVITSGVDGWHSMSSGLYVNPVSLTGTLNGVQSVTRQPGHNTGAFVQGQLDVREALFLTYGLRVEWNPNFGQAAQPNYAPRYGIAYTRDLGPVTTKLRFSYGRSTRPPAVGEDAAGVHQLGSSLLGRLFGPFDSQLPNPELGPEFQQGGEGGLELYFGKHGSLVATRYNQTVDALIVSVPGVDSIRSLLPNTDVDCTIGFLPVFNDGFCRWGLSRYLNVGSIRNQGWELQGTANTGPFTTKGTYSWTKSRIIGITPTYRQLLSGTYTVGQPFQYLPEHTWALSMSYSSVATTLSLDLTGIGSKIQGEDALYGVTGSSVRLATMKPRMDLPTNYQYVSPSYMTADLNATRRFSSRVDGVLAVKNLTDRYENDYSQFFYATLGRQSQAGLRLRW